MNRPHKQQRKFTFITALTLLVSAAPTVKADFLSDFNRQLKDAVRKGVEDGMRKSGGTASQQIPRRVNGAAIGLFGGGALQAYEDPGPDGTFVENLEAVSVGNFSRSGGNAATPAALAFAKSTELDGPDFNQNVVMSSVQWACFGQLRDADKGSYLQQLMGTGNATDISSRNDPKARRYRVDLINNHIKGINTTLAGEDANVKMARMSTVYSGDSAGKQRDIDLTVTRAKTTAINRAVKAAVEIVALNPTSATAGHKAIELLDTTIKKVDIPPSQEARCTLNYLEDRYGNKSDEGVVKTYQEILAMGTANPGKLSDSAVSCPVATSLATKLIDANQLEDAYRVVSSASRLARQRFDKNDMRTFNWPTQSCKYVTWLEGMMQYHGVGVTPSAHNAADAFRACADGLDVCAYNLAYLLATGETQAAANGEMKRMLEIASSSGNPGRSAKARNLLTMLARKTQETLDKNNRQVCENTSDATNGKKGEPSARDMCTAYLDYMDKYTSFYNSAPGSMEGFPAMQALFGASQYVAGGKVAYYITDFSKGNCETPDTRLRCSFNRNLWLKFEHGPLASESGMPLGRRDQGYFTKTANGWKVEPIRHSSSSSAAKDDRICMDTTFLSPTETAVAATFGCIK